MERTRHSLHTVQPREPSGTNRSEAEIASLSALNNNEANSSCAAKTRKGALGGAQQQLRRELALLPRSESKMEPWAEVGGSNPKGRDGGRAQPSRLCMNRRINNRARSRRNHRLQPLNPLTL